jgi:hypothetical protein
MYFYNNPVMSVAGNVTFDGNGGTVGTGIIAAGGGLEIVSGTQLVVPPELTLSVAGPLLGGGDLFLLGGDVTVGLTNSSAFTGGILVSNDSSLAFTGTGFTTPATVMVNDAGSSLRLAAGQRLQANGTGLNYGWIEVLGNSQVLGGTSEIEFGDTAVNGGDLTGRDAVLRFDGGLTNQWSLALTGGVNDVFGDIDNQPSGKLIVTGGATATFYDDVTQNGALRVSKVGSTNSVAVFLGDVFGGGGSGGGDIFYEGAVHPGSSPALITFENDVTFGSGATLEIELGGTMQGSEYDALKITGALALGGTLNAVPTSLGGDVFQPGEGDVFEILAATGGITGGFASMNLPDLTGDLYWNVLQDADTFSLEVLAPGLPGDLNADGSVDAADYVVWRKTDGTPAGYEKWRTHFGQSGGGSGASANATTPEPATLVMLMFSAAGWCLRRRRAA